MPEQPLATAVWRPQLLRLTAFTTSTYGAEAVKWWDAVVAEPPESKTEKIKESLVSVEGPCGLYRMVLNCTLNRVDWILAGELKPDDEISEMPSIGEVAPTLRLFGERLIPWLESAPPTVRLAFGSILVIPAANKVEGYKLLQDHVRALAIDAEKSSDLLYQINRPRPSAIINGLIINRLSKWSVALMQRFAAGITGGEKPTFQSATFAPALSGCRLELDINTAADNAEPLAQNMIRPLYDELTTLALEIVNKGDIP